MGAQAPFLQDRSTSLRGATPQKADKAIYIHLYIHSTHFVLFMSNSSSEKDSIYIYTYAGYIDLVQFADSEMSEKYRNANVFPLIFRDTNHEAEGRGNFSRYHFSWTKIACF